MLTTLLRLALLLSLTGCGSKPANIVKDIALKERVKPKVVIKQLSVPLHPGMASAIAQAPPASKKVLYTINKMMQADEVIVGACWDYLNEAFTRAGYPHSRRQIVFKGKYKGGKYADSDLIKPGDWLYYVNHSYHDIEHSGLFIGWTDRAKHEALIFSYAGEGRKNPARLRIYHIDQVYHIMRAKD